MYREVNSHKVLRREHIRKHRKGDEGERSGVPSKRVLIVMGVFLIFYIPPSFFFTRGHMGYLLPAVMGGFFGEYLVYWLFKNLI
jgi:hypothetical protein